MAAPLNNARLLSFAAYEDLRPGFAQIFHAADGNWQQFFKRVRDLGELPKTERHAALASVGGAEAKKCATPG